MHRGQRANAQVQRGVAVVILNWRRPEDTAACLHSVYSLVCTPEWVIVVDNHSGDGSDVRLRQEFPDTELIITERNLGYAGGNNRGIQRALALGADVVMVLNNDTVLHPRALAALTATAEQPGVGAVGPKMYYADDQCRLWCAGGKIDTATGTTIHRGGYEIDTGQYDDPADVSYLTGAAILFRAEALRAVGLFDPDYFLVFEDTDWCVRAQQQGYRLRYEPQAMLWHQVSTSFGGVHTLRYHYYFTRNNLLFVLKRLPKSRWPAIYARLLYRDAHFIWQLYRRGRPEAAAEARMMARAYRDFLLHRWGGPRVP